LWKKKESQVQQEFEGKYTANASDIEKNDSREIRNERELHFISHRGQILK
jgi:hypothetical protein